MSEPVGISVVIPTYQRCATVERALRALARQTMRPAAYEAIVVIDGSDDGTLEALERFEAPYRLHPLWQPNRGRAAARNAGLAVAQGQLVVFLDDDMEPDPGFLSAHWNAHPPDSRRAVLGPVPIPVDQSSTPLVRYRSSSMQVQMDRLARPGRAPDFTDVYSGNLSVPRAILREVGGFDEAFRRYGYEDYELGLRLLKAGVEIAYAPDATAQQRYDKDFAAMALDCIARGHAAVLFAHKHPEAAAGLKLATYHNGSRKWRAARSLLLQLGLRLRAVPDGLAVATRLLESRRSRRLHGWYSFALDYFFWLGAIGAQRGAHEPTLEPAPRPAGAAAAGSTDGVRTPVRIRFGTMLVVLFALVSSARLLVRTMHEGARASRPDEISRYEARFQGLREVLPAGARVGYIGSPPREGAEGSRIAFERYVLTQYALLPAIVVPATGAGLVVGNFESRQDSAALTAGDLMRIRDYGDGVMLFRRSTK